MVQCRVLHGCVIYAFRWCSAEVQSFWIDLLYVLMVQCQVPFPMVQCQVPFPMVQCRVLHGFVVYTFRWCSAEVQSFL